MSRKFLRNNSRIKRLRLLAGLLVAVLSFAALAAAQSVRSRPTPSARTRTARRARTTLDLTHPWVVSDGTIITPAGTQVYLGITTRAKAIALNPNTQPHRRRPSDGRPTGRHDFQHPDRRYPADLQQPISHHTGPIPTAATGIAYTPDGKYLLFSQDGNNYYGSLQQG